MKKLVFLFSLLCLGVGAGKAEAFTLIEMCSNAAMAASICATSDDPQVQECCKCNSPCANGEINPAFAQCISKKEKCPGVCVPTPPTSECETDAQCELDKDPCTAPKCNKVAVDGICPPGTMTADGATKWGAVIGKCQKPETPIDNCMPPSKDCGDLFPGNPDAQKCCKEYGLTDPAENKCCVEHVTHGEPVKDPATGKLIPCNGGDCPQCPNCEQPKVNCDLIGDPKLKSCCVEKGGLLWFMMDKCIPDGPDGSDDCNIVINAGGDFINNGQMNICCQVVNNTGTITDTTISQACNNTTGGGPGGGTATGGTPTIPEGSASALTCSVALVGAPVDGKFAINYTVPASAGPVVSATLTQLSGSQIKVEGEAEPADFGATVTSPKSMSTKSISDPNNPPSFSVFAPTPKSMVGEWKAPFEVKVTLNTLGGEAGSALCTEDHFLHAEGTGCGCNMTATLTAREQAVAYAVLASLLALPLFSLRLIRAAGGQRKKGFEG